MVSLNKVIYRTANSVKHPEVIKSVQNSSFENENNTLLNETRYQIAISKEPWTNLWQEGGKRSGQSVSLHSRRPLICTYVTMTAVVEVIFCTFYYVVEAREYCDLTRHLGNNHALEFLPHLAIRPATTMLDGWSRFIAIIKPMEPNTQRTDAASKEKLVDKRSEQETSHPSRL